MIKQIYKTICYGCNACQSVCPKNAITMMEDPKGFLTPVISDACISCGKCVQVCRSPISLHQVKQTYIGKLRDSEAQMESQSGGAFSAIAHVILQKGGVVYGAALDEKWEAHHIRITDLTGLKQLKGSKYIPSRMENVHHMVADDLCRGQIVLFSGTPCQINGLNHVLEQQKIPTEHLYTIDLICHGTPSVLIWRDLLRHYEKQWESPVKEIIFRGTQKWEKSESVFIFQNGNTTCTHDYLRLFGSALALRDSCYTCEFAKKERIGDFTIGDAWGVKEHNPDCYDEKGVSLILCNTEKANRLFIEVRQEMDIKEVLLEDYCQEQMKNPTTPNRDSAEFWNDYRTKSFSFIIRKYAKNNFFLNWKYILKKIRRALHVSI